MSLKRVQSDLEHRLGGTRHFRAKQAVKRPEDARNTVAVGIIDRIVATTPQIPEAILSRYDAAWSDEDPAAMDRAESVMEEEARRLGFGADPSDATEFVEGFLAKLTPAKGAEVKTGGEDAETAFLTAHAAAFVASSHLSGKARISGISDDEARRQREEANATMKRLRPSDDA